MLADGKGDRIDGQHVNGAYQIFMLLLCLYAVMGLAVGALVPIPAETHRLLEAVDIGVCALFFADFVYCLIRAEDKWRYFRTWGWIDLLSSAPMINALRAGRLLRVLRIIRVLRALRATKSIVSYLFRRKAQSAAVAVVTVALSMILFSSIAVLNFEAGADGNIKTAEDALWWAMTTITTVGYGDKFPVTLEGRAVAAMLMTVGVGLFGTLSGLIASWFVAPEQRSEASEIEQLKASVEEMKELLRRGLSAEMDGSSPLGKPLNRIE